MRQRNAPGRAGQGAERDPVVGVRRGRAPARRGGRRSCRRGTWRRRRRRWSARRARAAQTQGRARRSGIGWLHQRPLNFQTLGGRSAPSAVTIGRGHSASTAAAIAAASSSVAAGRDVHRRPTIRQAVRPPTMAAVASSAGWNSSTCSSSRVMSTGVPIDVFVENHDWVRSPTRKQERHDDGRRLAAGAPRRAQGGDVRVARHLAEEVAQAGVTRRRDLAIERAEHVVGPLGEVERSAAPCPRGAT